MVSKQPNNYSYVPFLTARVFHLRESDKSNFKEVAAKPDSPPERLAQNIGHYAAPPTEQLKKEYASRF